MQLLVSKVCNKPQKVQREPYSGPTMADNVAANEDSCKQTNGGATDRPDDFHARPVTRGGGRNMQDSSFTFSGKLAERVDVSCIHR